MENQNNQPKTSETTADRSQVTSRGMGDGDGKVSGLGGDIATSGGDPGDSASVASEGDNLAAGAREFNNMVSKWRTAATAAERAITDATSTANLSAQRDVLQARLVSVCDVYIEFCPIVTDEFELSLTVEFRKLEEDNLNLISNITQRMREVQYEEKSVSGHSKCFFCFW